MLQEIERVSHFQSSELPGSIVCDTAGKKVNFLKAPDGGKVGMGIAALSFLK